MNTTNIAVNFNQQFFEYNDVVDMLVRMSLPHIMHEQNFKLLIVPFLTTQKRQRAYYSAYMGKVQTQAGEQLALKFDMRLAQKQNDIFKDLELYRISLMSDVNQNIQE